MTRLNCCLAVLPLLAAFALPGNSQQPAGPTPGDQQIEKYLAAETDRLSQRVLDGATTLKEWQRRLPRLRQEYLYMLGLSPLPEKTPLQATVTGTLERDAFVVEKVHFQSRPGLYVTGSLYRPKEVKGKLPAVLYVCGHSDRGRDGNRSAFQHHGMWFASHGYVCLAIDSLQLGEIRGIHHGTYKYDRWWWHSRGYTPAGVECWNGIRAIDYLLTRPEVDPERIGVTGISGGGAATFWIAAADERVKCAVPVSGLSDLESYVKNKVINGHCDCMFLHNAYGWEWTTIAALVAPRPLLFANSDNDRIFPMDGNRRVIERLRKLYTMYGKAELVDEYVSKGGHDDRPDLRVAAFQWFNRHLKGDTTSPIGTVEFEPFPGKEQRVFPEDKDLPPDAINAKIDETFVPKAEVKLPAEREFGKWKQVLLYDLASHSFGARSSKVSPPQLITFKYSDGSESQALRIGSLGDIETTKMHETGKTEILWVASEDDKGPLMRPILAGKNVRVVFPTGSPLSAFAWTAKSPPNYAKRAHALLGQTMHLNQVRDVVLVRRYLLDTEKTELTLVGSGQAGVVAAYAALFAPGIKEVVIFNPPKSHMEGPHFLNVMRVLDIPEALGLLAPHVKLTLINANDPAFDRTEEIYRLVGAQANFRRVTQAKKEP